MEDFILNLLETAGSIDFKFVGQVLSYGLVVFWFVVLYWVWLDSGERTSNKTVKISYVILVAVLNVVGFLIYLIIRPSQTIEEIYWADLERRYLKYETAELGDCPKCGSQLFPGYTFCPNCRYKLKMKCPRCNVYVDKKNKFCPHCGQELRKRRSPEQEFPTKEVMQQQIQATKEEAKEVVESEKTRYSQKGGLAMKTGESIVGGYKLIFGKIRGTFNGKKKRDEEKSPITDTKEKQNKKGKKKREKKKVLKKKSSKTTK
ncbi:MAG TPA: zinc ribbon domain-containing protein [Candidatus Dojkabacteria bacterium]|nr:zinc ribbon domain-containing protein [Candidatus Dojkabacteria bacterium]